jgi:hypothetical protein
MEDRSFVPDWLNKEFLKSAIQNEVSGSNIEVTKYDAQLAVSSDNNLAGCLLRVRVEYSFTDKNHTNSTGTKHLVVKSLPKSQIMLTVMTQTGIFKRETDMYLVALPTMYRVAEELTGSKIQYLTSRCVYSEPNILVLEDLNHMGYKMADRRSGLDLPHCQLALRSLARFHGMSVALHRQDASSMTLFKEVFYKEEQRAFLSSFFENGAQVLASVVAKWSGYERFADKIRKMAETIVTKTIEIVKPKENSLSVLNHGDFWTNNMLFKYSSGSEVAEEIMFVDFQQSRFSSPALDLQYFMYTTPSQEVRYNHMDDLLETYHAELRKMLQVLGCSDVEFTYEHLKKEFEDKAYFGLFTACAFLSIMLVDPKECKDLENMKPDDLRAVEGNPMEKAFSGTLYRETFQQLLLHFESTGLL